MKYKIHIAYKTFFFPLNTFYFNNNPGLNQITMSSEIFFSHIKITKNTEKCFDKVTLIDTLDT